jgi:hypothetical protein
VREPLDSGLALGEHPFMRNFLLGLTVVALVPACGGNEPPRADANPMGMECEPGDPCGGAGFACVEGACTTTGCTASTQCAAGTECRNVDGTFACVTQAWSGGTGQYGTNCALHGAADCASGYACVSVREGDPYAYCTTACSSDRNCPPEYLCGTEQGDPTMKCIRRELCAPCNLDEQCITPITADGECADDGSGMMVCTKRCDPKGEGCQPVFACTGAPGEETCAHKSGSCFGDGSMCAPCQIDTDCSQTSGSRCIRLYFSGEKFCSPPCGAGCPTGSFCASIGGSNSCIPDNPDNTCESWPF